MRHYRKLAYLLVMLCFTTAVAAQATTCAAIVQQALAGVQQDCAPTARNQACYGYVSLSATPRDGVQNFNFAKDGDLANVADIDTLRLSAFNPTDNTWGIALMKLQANLPDTLPGQNVTFLMFGDVQVQNAVAPGTVAPPTVALTIKSSANIRSTPSTSGAVIGSLGKNDAVTANGRNSDSTWLRVQIPNSSDQGWVFASLVTPDGDVSTLSVVDSTDETTAFTPMQAFYFQTGLSQTSCAEAPADGILIQTPEGVGQINLRANDVDVQLGSTGFFQAQPSGNMTVSVVEGEGHITSNGKTVAVPAGTQVTIPVDANLKATGAPSDAKPYDPAQVANLPVQVLPEQIAIALPATAEAPSTGGGLTNLPGPLAGFDGLSGAAFCQYMGTALSQAGMSMQEYTQMIQQVLAYIPADQKGDVDQFIQMIQSCP